MLSQMTLQELAAELQNQSTRKKDFIANTKQLRMESGGSGVRLHVDDHGSFSILPYAHGQMAQRLNIPKRFYDRLHGSYPALLADTVTTILHNEPEDRMVRAWGDPVNPTVRAFLSNRYRRIDHVEVAEASLPLIIVSHDKG